jgi:cell division protein ZapE
MPDGPMARYRAMVAAGELRHDPVQAAAVEKLQLLHMRLRDYDPRKGKRVARGWFGFGRGAPHKQIKLTGLYLYGGVGRGKSMLMDLFHGGAPVSPKRRVHFHAFMQEVHVGVHIARESNVPDPIRTVAEEIAEGATLLCFDEVQVTDITDAMILGRLFEALFDRGVVVVATSNRPPDDLYKDGLNREQFLPFIALLKERMDVLELASPHDYRMGREAEETRYVRPLGPAADRAMDEAWKAETGGAAGAPVAIDVGRRQICIPRAAGRVGRADFRDLCEKPLGARDYLEVARRFDVLILENVPAMTWAQNNEAKRFVTLIDALYEGGVKLYLSAEAPAEELYAEGKGAFEFGRTVSRLAEMRSSGWPAERAA